MATAQHEIPTTRPRALIVDDSQIARYVLCGQLMRLGFDVDAANSAEAALDQLRGPLPDVVFMDHLLPGINGLDAVRRLRCKSRYSQVPIVMYTSQEGAQFAARARDSGADDVYVKTEDESALFRILRRLDLVEASADAPTPESNVLLLRGRTSPPADRAPVAEPARDDLREQIGSMMDTQYEKLRRDLLAEFSILERHEERMRRDLFTRVEDLTLHTVEKLQHTPARPQPAYRRWSLAMAACTILAVALGFTTLQKSHERIGDIEATSASALAALESQVIRLEELNTSLREQAVSAPAEAGLVPSGPTESVGTGGLAEPPSAVAALVAELQGMGILGSVRIQTSAGAFCVGSTPTGFRMEASGQTLDDCEVLPMLMSAAAW